MVMVICYFMEVNKIEKQGQKHTEKINRKLAKKSLMKCLIAYILLVLH